MSSIDALKKRLMEASYYKTINSGNSYTVEDRVEDLKQNPDFAGWSDEDLYNYAKSLFDQRNERVYRQFIEGINKNLGIHGDGEWSQFTYEEILQMDDNGVQIPDEVLKWAHSMQASNVVDYEIESGDANDVNDTDSTKSDVGEAGNTGLTNIAKVFFFFFILQEAVLQEAEKNFEQYSTQLNTASDDALAVQNNALKEVQNMMNQWQAIDNKVKAGETLSADEQAKYGELGLLMSNIVNNSTVQIANYMSDFDEISKLMQATSKEAKIAQDYANDTSFTGSLIAEYESSPKSSASTNYSHVYTGAVGIVDLIKSNAIGKNLSVAAIQQSGHLQNTAYSADKSIKEVSKIMNNMTDDVESGSRNISLVVSENASEAVSQEPKNEETSPPADVTPEGEEIPAPPENSEDNENKNVFAQEEDFNNIDSIIKRQQKQAPNPESQDIIVDN